MKLKELIREKTFEREGEAALVVSVRLWTPDGRAERGGFARGLEFFYSRLAMSYIRSCKRWLYPAAIAEKSAARERGASFTPLRAELRGVVTLNDGRYFSQYIDRREPGLYLRFGDAWDAKEREPVKPPHWARARVTSAAAGLVERCELYLSPSWQESLETNFSARRFYLDENGYTIFYQPMTVAPRESGIVAIPVGTE